MKFLKSFTLICVSLIFLCGCASSAPGPQLKMLDISTNKPSDDNSTIYFIRQHSWTQKAVKSTFYINNMLVGTLADDDDNYTYMTAEVPRGSYDITYKMHDMFGGRTMTGNITLNRGRTLCYIVWKATLVSTEECPDVSNGKYIGTMKLSK